MKVVLERLIEGKVKSGYPLRDTRIACVVTVPPEIGKQAVFVGESRDFVGGSRLITTSPVTLVDNSMGDTTYFETETGSRYGITPE